MVAGTAVAAVLCFGGLAVAGERGTPQQRDLGGTCFGRAATITGTAGADEITGTSGADVIVALGGDDQIAGRGAGDLLCGGGGSDDLSGAGGADRLNGGRDDDLISGAARGDVLRGRAGDDRLRGGAGDDALGGGPGVDACDGGPGSNRQRACERPGGGGGGGAGGGGGTAQDEPNRDPKAIDDADSTDEATANAVDVLANDTDADGDALKVQSVAGSPAGEVTITGGGSAVDYDPNGQFESLGAGATATETFTYIAKDGNGGTDTATVTVTVNGLDDAPLAVTDPATLAEDDPTTAIDVLANDSDVDGGPKSIDSKTDGAHGAVAITDGGTGLTYTPDPDYCGPDSFTYTLNGGSSTTVSITLTCVDDPGTAVDDAATMGEDSGATTINVLSNDTDIDGSSVTGVTQPANGTVAITGAGQSVSYTPNANLCSPPDETFTYTVPGGSTATVAVTVTCQNDAPGNTVPGAQATAEDTSLVFSSGNGNAISTADIDAGAANLEVTLTATHGRLTLGAVGGLAFTTGDGTADPTMTFTGTVANINTALGGLAYSPDADYNGPASLQIVTDDQGNTGAGGAQSDTDSVAITVGAVDDAPALDLDSGAGGTGSDSTFNETDPHIGNGVLIAPNAEITDVDDTDIESATVTLTNRPDGDGFESLSADAGATGITVNYTAATGVLALGGSHSVADYEQVLQSIRYDNTKNPPDSVDRTINVKVNDSDVDSNTAGATVDVVPLNDPPAVDLNGAGAGVDTTASFTEDGGAVDLAPAADVTDTDDTDLAGATITLTNHPDAGSESLSVDTTGTSITAAAYVPGTGVLALSGTDSVADYQAVLRTADYDNSSNAPNTAARAVELEVDDGQDESAVATSTVSVTAANDAPSVDLNGVAGGIDATASFTEDGGPITLAGSTLVADVDDANLESATITLTNRPDGADEGLSVDTTGTSITAAAYVPGTGVLALSGTDSVADYQAVLRTAEYDNADQDPNPTDRSVAFKVNDGSADSPTATATVTITAVNDAPALTQPDGNLSYSEDTPSEDHADAIAPNLTALDPDTNINGATVEITGNYANGQDVLSFANTAQITGTFTAANGRMTLSGNTTVANYQAALRDVNYSNTSETPSTVTRTVSFQADDGQALNHASNTVTRQIDVVATNDAPTDGNESQNASSNTRLEVELTSGASTNPKRTSATGSLLDNANDVDGPAPLVISPEDTSDPANGSLSVNSDGSYVYTPDAGYTGADSFTYRVEDSSGAESAPSMVSITVGSNRIWYVRADAAGGGDGRSETPFDTLDEADVAASASGDTIYVFRKSGDAGTVSDASVDLLSSQKLIGSLVDLTDGAATLYTGGAGLEPSATSTSAKLDDANTVRGMTIGGSGSPAIVAGSGDASGTLDKLTLTGNAGGVELANGASGTWDLSDVTANTSGGDAFRAASAGTVNFAATGTISVTASAGRGLNLTGTTISGTVDSTTVTSSTEGVVLDDNPGSLTLNDINLTTTGTGLSIDSSNDVTVSGGDADVSAGGAAVSLTTDGSTPANPPDVTLDQVSSTGGARGVNIDDIGAGTFSAAGGALSGHTAAEIDVNGGSGNVTYAGAINNGSGLSAELTGRTGGTIALSGNINDTNDADGGISMSSNSGGTFNFSGSTKKLDTGASAAFSSTGSNPAINFTGGGLDIDASSGAGFTASGGGTVSVQGSGNTIDTTTATALNVASTTIGASHVTFQSITAGTAADSAGNGIVLDTTGSAGGLHVTGTGAAGTGGTIQHKTGADGSTAGGIGIYLNSTSNVQLARMQLNNFNNFGIYGTSVTGFTMANSVISGTTGDSTGSGDAPIAFGKSNPSGTNGLLGTGNSVTDVNISGGIEHNFELYNQSGSFSLDVTQANIHDNSVGGGSDGILMEMQGTASATLDVDDSDFTNNKSQGIQVAANDSSSADVTINNSDFVRGTQGNEGIVLSNGSNGDLTTHVTNNRLNGWGGVSIFVGQTAGNATSSSQLDATIQGNTITTPTTATNHAIIAFLSSNSGSTQQSHARLLIDNNTITQNATTGVARAILVDAPDNNTAPDYSATVTRNNVDVLDGVSGVLPIDLAVRKGVVGQAATMCADVALNDVDFPNGTPGGVNGVRVRSATDSVTGVAGVATLETRGQAGAAAAVLTANNLLSTTEIGGTVGVSGANCPTPP